MYKRQGPSGSGKTTLLNVIGALDSPSEGRVVVAGQDITRASRKELFAFRRHGVSFVFQTFNLFPALTALENVEFGADAAGQDHVREVARCWIASGSPSERLTSPTSCWAASSNGSDRAPLASGNPILLADEPTGELDFHTGVRILELLHEQTNEADTTVLIVTHNREIARVAHRVIELSSGGVVSDGPPEGGPAEIADLQW